MLTLMPGMRSWRAVGARLYLRHIWLSVNGCRFCPPLNISSVCRLSHVSHVVPRFISWFVLVAVMLVHRWASFRRLALCQLKAYPHQIRCQNHTSSHQASGPSEQQDSSP
jgi:hypothetical protein